MLPSNPGGAEIQNLTREYKEHIITMPILQDPFGFWGGGSEMNEIMCQALEKSETASHPVKSEMILQNKYK